MTSVRSLWWASATRSCVHVLPSTSSIGLLVYWIVFILGSPEGINLSVLFTPIRSTFTTTGTRQVSQIKCWTDRWQQRVRKGFAKNDLELLASPFFMFPKEQGPSWDFFFSWVHRSLLPTTVTNILANLRGACLTVMFQLWRSDNKQSQSCHSHAFPCLPLMSLVSGVQGGQREEMKGMTAYLGSWSAEKTYAKLTTN